MSEIEAMGGIDKALGALEPDEQRRVLRWAVDKYGGGEVPAGGRVPAPGFGGAGLGETDGAIGPSYARIVDLMDAANPGTVVEHVLVASYWFQVVNGQESFTGQAVNGELKDLGHPASNITDSFSSLMHRKPPAVRQVQKSGNTKQARKLYRLTEVGIRTVESMIREEANGD
jgi:hypothetical protein